MESLIMTATMTTIKKSIAVVKSRLHAKLTLVISEWSLLTPTVKSRLRMVLELSRTMRSLEVGKVLSGDSVHTLQRNGRDQKEKLINMRSQLLLVSKTQSDLVLDSSVLVKVQDISFQRLVITISQETLRDHKMQKFKSNFNLKRLMTIICTFQWQWMMSNTSTQSISLIAS